MRDAPEFEVLSVENLKLFGEEALRIALKLDGRTFAITRLKARGEHFGIEFYASADGGFRVLRGNETLALMHKYNLHLLFDMHS